MQYDENKGVPKSSSWHSLLKNADPKGPPFLLVKFFIIECGELSYSYALSRRGAQRGCRILIESTSEYKKPVPRSPVFGPICFDCDPSEHKASFRATQMRREFPFNRLIRLIFGRSIDFAASGSGGKERGHSLDYPPAVPHWRVSAPNGLYRSSRR